jgi:hypothetical protein
MRTPIAALFLLLAAAEPGSAADRLCDTAYEDCRAPLLALIQNERVGIDVAFWFMEDARYTAALGKKLAEGVPVRVLVDVRANSSYPLNADRLGEMREAKLPMRRRTASGILHWKMMLFEGQNTVEFSAANFTSSFVPNVPYENYIDEVVVFSDDTAVVDSFRTKYDDLWTDDTAYADYANVVRPLSRHYPISDKDPALNFPPRESYRQRAVAAYDTETEGIDVIMYRITDRAHTDALIRALQRGVPVRLIILSPRNFVSHPPGLAKQDSAVYPEYVGEGSTPAVDGELVLYASHAATVGDAFATIADPSAAGGFALQSVDHGSPKIVDALAVPASYAELQFVAEAQRPYRLWVRGRASGNYWANDSVHIQFSDSIDADGRPLFRSGTTSSAVINLEDCSGCGVRNWGWQDNGWGVGVLGPLIAFATAGVKTLRIQNREDGLSIDQIVLSPSAYRERSPGTLENDTTVLPERDRS